MSPLPSDHRQEVPLTGYIAYTAFEWFNFIRKKKKIWRTAVFWEPSVEPERRLSPGSYLFFYVLWSQTVRHERPAGGRSIRGVGRVVARDSDAIGQAWQTFGERLGACSKEGLIADIQNFSYRPEPVGDNFLFGYLRLQSIRLFDPPIVPDKFGIDMPRYSPRGPLRGRPIGERDVRALLRESGLKKVNGTRL